MPQIIITEHCSSCAETLSTLHCPGIIWFDAHGDFNTPETSISGSIDGMALAIATGRCHPEMMPNPVKEENVVLMCARDFDPLEEALLRESRVLRAGLEDLPSVIERMPAEIYLHIDVDVLGPGGITPEQLYNSVQKILASGKLSAVMIANCERDKKTSIKEELVQILTTAHGDAPHGTQ